MHKNTISYIFSQSQMDGEHVQNICCTILTEDPGGLQTINKLQFIKCTSLC